MRQRIGYKSVRWSTIDNFDGTAVTQKNGPGKFNFDDLEKQASAQGLQNLVVPVFSVSYFAASARATIDLYLRDPSNVDARKLIFSRDATDPTRDFIEDNLGEGWPVPYLDGNAGNRYELVLVTTGATAPAEGLLEVWFEAAPNLGVYRSLLKAQGVGC